MLKTPLFSSLFLILILSHQVLVAQCINGLQINGKPCPNPISTAVPFLRIIPDARSGAMGDVGIALTPDANSILYNASNLATADRKWGASVNYSPWFLNFGFKDIFLLHEAGYFQFGQKSKQAVGLGVQYFSLGNIEWTDFNTQKIDTSYAYEMAITGAYARQLNENWALGFSTKYIHSDLGRRETAAEGYPIRVGRALAVDLSATYKKPISISHIKTNLVLGATISNVGNKITYSRESSFLPANLGIGGSYEMIFNKNNRLLIALEFNKLLVPTPNPFDTLSNEIQSPSVLNGIIRSFTDAPRGFREEMQEINTSIGLEYWLFQHLALRAGYFHESDLKGGRQYLTIGGGLRYRKWGAHVSYLASQSSFICGQNPLNHTWRFSLLVNGVSW
ncbi:MAG: type IX secretion system outer membrane channel protein PorV [Saprospiraceae bacterium]|nr:type IX secretion system outer membrane channel protein PorV [Saprospiraceae bacterium]